MTARRSGTTFKRRYGSVSNRTIILFSFSQSSLIRKSTQPAQEFSVHFLSTFGIFTIKSTPLFALFASERWSVSLLWISASLTLWANKCCDYIAIVTSRRLFIVLLNSISKYTLKHFLIKLLFISKLNKHLLFQIAWHSSHIFYK